MRMRSPTTYRKPRRLSGTLLICLLLAFALPAHAAATDTMPDMMPDLESAAHAAFIETLIEVASEEVGYEARGSGYTKYAEWGGGNKYGEWCSEFTAWCVDQADQRLGTQYLDTWYPMQHACITGVNWYQSRGRYVSATGELRGYGAQWWLSDGVPLAERRYMPKRGDLIFFEWYQYNRIDHVAIVEELVQNEDGSYTVHTIEGNGRDSTAVERFAYAIDDESIRAYGVMTDAVGTTLKKGCEGEMVRQLQQCLADAGYLSIEPTGTYADLTIRAVRAVQKEHGLEESGVADQATQQALGFVFIP